MTRRIVSFHLCSLDGAVDDPTRGFPVDAPGPPAYDSVMERQEARLIGAQDCMLLGRGMYDEWSEFWPTVRGEPFADFANSVKKYVVTSRPLDREWGAVEPVTGPLTEIVADLKERPGDGDIGVHGSITLTQSLLAHDLVDEVQLAVAPVLDPVGRRLSDGLADLTRLTLVEAVPTPGGALWLTYRRSSLSAGRRAPS
ncbi:MAG TPA: dihydrofolate reductase family protein [Nocardioides sp.]|nr:dihydrofolate reductase family protein [Nocardioides sp.]